MDCLSHAGTLIFIRIRDENIIMTITMNFILRIADRGLFSFSALTMLVCSRKHTEANNVRSHTTHRRKNLSRNGWRLKSGHRTNLTR